MFRAEDISGRTLKRKQPHTSILPYLKAEEEKSTQSKVSISKAVKKPVVSPEERLKDNKALDCLAPPSDDELRLKALLEEV